MNFYLKRKIEEWFNENLISYEIYDKIINYENQKNKSNLFFLSLLFIAFFSISLGILSLIAANWDSIPYYVKIFSLLMVQGVTGYLYLKKEKKIYKEGLLILFIFLFLVILSLLSQTFQLEGKLHHLFLIWGVLSLGPALLSEMIFTPLLVFINLTISLFMFFIDIDLLNLNPTFLYYLNEYFYFFTSFIINFYIFLIAQKLINNNHINNLFKTVIFIFYLFSLFYFHFLWYSLPSSDKTLIDKIYILLFLLIYQILVWIYIIKKISIDKYYIFYIIFILFFLNYSLIGIFSESIANQILGTFLYISQFILLSYILISLNHYFLFNFIFLLILLRIFLIYIEIFKDLTLTGFGLSGFGFIILLLYFIYKKVILIINRKRKIKV